MVDSSRRKFRSIRATLREDASNRVYLLLWMPLLLVQLVLYCLMLWRFFESPEYAPVPDPEHPLLKENHIQNLVSLKSQPELWLLGTHVAMAWLWIAGTLGQKALVSRMARGGKAFVNARRLHVILGWSLCSLAFVGIIIGTWLAYDLHGSEQMRWFLVAQPLFFLPAIGAVVLTAKRRAWSIRHHRFWAETTFLGPGLASLWTEVGIHVGQRMTSFGIHEAEFWASAAGGAIGFAVVVIPAWIALRRGLVSDAASTSTAAG